MNTVTVSEKDARWLEELLKDVPPTSELDLESYAAASHALDEDPAYVADVLKSQFVVEVCNAMQEQGIKANQLAGKWGKSRQYLSKILKEDKRVNFTIGTMVELLMQLDRRLELHFPRKGEHTFVMHCLNHEPNRPAWDSRNWNPLPQDGNEYEDSLPNVA